MKGLCIIPEGRVTKDCKKSGAIFEVSYIANLDKYLEYASNKDLGVVYLSTHKGVVYQDDIIESSPRSLYQYTFAQRKLWSGVISEQIARTCVWYSTKEVYFMADKISSFSLLIEELKRRGVSVHLPFLGKR